MAKPNILFIFTDQQARHAMSTAGNPDLHTPHMDALAAAGVRFHHSYCTSPVCSPARASLMTGMMPHATGVDVNALSIRPELPTMGEIFRDAGYETAWAGKWHVPEGFPTAPDAIRGFENLALPWLENRRLGLVSDEPITDMAVNFLERDHDNPFLLTVSLQNPHDICYWIRKAHPELLAAFNPPGRAPSLPANFEIIPDEPEFIQICRKRKHYGEALSLTEGWTREDWITYLNVYYRLTEHVDVQVGRLLDAVRRRGLERDTLVVFTSDHGEGSAAHRWVVKLMLYEEPATVPLIFSWPGVIPAGTVDTVHLASGADLLPTLCDYAGVPVPPGLHGQSLRPVIEQPELPGREFLATELQPDPQRPELKGRLLRTRRFKYLAFSAGRNPELLFDLEDDPGETRNLAALPSYADELQRHRDLLARWVAETNDSFV